MALDSKVTFMNSMEQRLQDDLTVSEMANVMSIVSDILEEYDMERVRRGEREEWGQDDLLEAYLSALKVQGRSPGTIERYWYVINKMQNSLKLNTRQITVYHLRKYLTEKKETGVKESTLEGERQIFSAYFNWLQREGLIKQNPVANLGAIKVPKRLRRAYSDVDIEKLKESCNNKRDKAIVCFLLSTGCRISEVTSLDRDSVDLKELECTVIGKGNKERTVFLDEVAGMALTEYLAERTDDDPALFIGFLTGKRLHPGGVREMLRKIGLDANVEHVHPHKFRRTMCTNLIKRGMPIEQVAAIAGHEKLDTTMKYVNLDKSQVRNSYHKFT